VSTARDALLVRCLEVLRDTGFGNLSLREIAGRVGTSHRMLLYHFGSREGLLAAVVETIEADQRDALAGLVGQGDLERANRAFWERLADPALAPAERLFFEVYAQALYGREWTDTFRAAVIDAWERPLVATFVGIGLDEPSARAHARLGLAVTRGLLLDLLLTGDRAAVDSAAELFGRLVASAARIGPTQRH
jgi:AcrR family transcriptional regulator